MTILTRRKFLVGLAAPVIVRATSLMPVSSRHLILPPWQYYGTVTGRMSFRGPNLTQIGRLGSTGIGEVRAALLKQYRVLEWDFAELEARVMAQLK